MKITVLINHDLASNFALNRLLPQLVEHEVTVFMSSKVGNKTSMSEPLRQLMFFEQQLFNDFLTPFMPKIDNGKFLSFDALSLLLTQPIQLLNEINSPGGLARLARTTPDLIVSIRYGVILNNLAISIPTLGVINLHSGLLPNYRGVMATFWAMLNQERHIGTTLHYINDASIDTGNIINQHQSSIDYQQSYLSQVLNLYIGGVEILVNAIAQLNLNKKLPSYIQPSKGSYFSFPTDDDLNQFFQRGNHLVKTEELKAFFQQYY